MKHRKRIVGICLLGITGAITLTLAQPAGAVGIGTASQAMITSSRSTRSCPWVKSVASPVVRASQVLAQMTVSEKIGMLYPPAGYGFFGYQLVLAPIPSLCVPSLILQDGMAGIRGTQPGTATSFPAAIAVGASFDATVANQYGAAIGREALKKNIDAIQGPFVNIARVPQAGRNAEGYGEDPFLTTQLADSDIQGMQKTGVFSVTQSITAYNQENNRTSMNENVSDRALHEIYLPPIEGAVQQGVGGVMCVYPSINGTPACQDPSLLTGILKEQFGFQGFVRTDFAAAPDDVAAMNAGTDFFNPFNLSAVTSAVQSGQIPLTRLNDAVARILSTMFRFGVFNRRSAGTANTSSTTPRDLTVALATAEQGTVLLQNNGPILPLDKNRVGSIAVIGADGSTAALTTESGTAFVAQLASNIVTPLRGIQAAAGRRTSVAYDDGTDLTSAAAAAAAAKVAVVFVSDPAGENTDLATLALPGNQNQLVAAVAAANPNTVVVINSGNPVLMPWLNQVKGVIEAWFPGQQDGTAIAAVLFGKVDPSGKLPMTFPSSDTASPVGTNAQWPGIGGLVQYSEGLDVGYRGYQADHIEPLFPFGFGLSYTTFAFSDLSIGTPVNGSIPVSATVTNTGKAAGAEVAQLYLGDPAAAGEPLMQLKGFDKVILGPGQSVPVTFELSPRDMSYWDSASQSWVMANGRYNVMLGDSSVNVPLSGYFSISG